MCAARASPAATTMPDAAASEAEARARLVPCAPGVTSHPFFRGGPPLRGPPPRAAAADSPPRFELVPSAARAVFASFPPDTEFSIRESPWVLLSEEEIGARFRALSRDGQTEFADVAVAYVGLGHVRVLSHYLKEGTVFERGDGGANPVERSDNYQSALRCDPSHFARSSFEDWLASA